GGWKPYRTEDVKYKPGERCDFALKAHVLRDREEYRDVALWDNGNVRTQEFRGALIMQWKNLETGVAVRRNQSGRAFFEYHRNGDLEELAAMTGHFSAGLPEGSTPGRGAYYVGGRWSSVVFAKDDTRTIMLGPDGTIENLCDTLG
ncbi:MAG: hypothetical protein ACR2JD_00695, partial [Nocardioides sp.]